VKVRVIGALVIEDEHGDDPKILSVLVSDARFDGYYDIQDVHKHRLKEIQEFYETYKRLEPHKWVRFKDWKNMKDAKEIVDYSINQFKNMKLK
jgi:inorganic pyrophosphatase